MTGPGTRAGVKRAYGASLAAKATDDLCRAVTRGAPVAVHAVIELGDDAPGDALLPRDGRARRAAIDALRGAFGRAAQPLLGALCSSSPSCAIEACWLSRTLSVLVEVELLATLAADRSILRIGLALPIRPEQRSAGVSVVLSAAVARARERGLSGRGVDVGVIDYEVQRDHPALDDRVVQRRNFTAEGFGRPHRHGTSVAGIIGADDASFRGVAPAATIHNYKLMAPGTPMAGAELAVEQALEDDMRIVNCSWGAGPVSDGSSPVARACDRAWKLGMTIVKSSGDVNLTTPADAAGIIVVGATNLAGTGVAVDSAKGRTSNGDRPHLVAPGGERGELVTSTSETGAVGLVKGGTSLAAPHVSGLLALALEREPDLRPEDLRARLLASCVPLAGVQPPWRQGHGLVDAAAFLGRA